MTEPSSPMTAVPVAWQFRYKGSVWQNTHADCKPDFTLTDVEYRPLYAAPVTPADGDVGELVDRLQNPMWAHSNIPFESPQLSKDDALADMAAAAELISRLSAEIADMSAKSWKYLQECGAQARRADASEARLAEAVEVLTALNVVDAHGYRVAPMSYDLQLRVKAVLDRVGGA